VETDTEIGKDPWDEHDLEIGRSVLDAPRFQMMGENGQLRQLQTVARPNPARGQPSSLANGKKRPRPLLWGEQQIREVALNKSNAAWQSNQAIPQSVILAFIVGPVDEANNSRFGSFWFNQGRGV
jgi:hypothetical protein